MPSSKLQPPQHQDNQPGIESKMSPRPDWEPKFQGVGKLKGKIALITGGDSGIGRAVAVAMAREGAKIVISYLNEDSDAKKTLALIEGEGSEGLLFSGDIGVEKNCQDIVAEAVKKFGRIDILVNNAAEQHECKDISDISQDQLERTYKTNIFSFFYFVKAALPHMAKGSSIINTASITAYGGNKTLLDYSSTKGAIVSFTRSLSLNLEDKGIRVNAVAPGPIWTPLIPASYDAEKAASHGSTSEMKRAGQPNEVAPCFVFLASDDASYMSGQVLHPNGGTIVES